MAVEDLRVSGAEGLVISPGCEVAVLRAVYVEGYAYIYMCHI
jgi:hypothetical protein